MVFSHASAILPFSRPTCHNFDLSSLTLSATVATAVLRGSELQPEHRGPEGAHGDAHRTQKSHRRAVALLVAKQRAPTRRCDAQVKNGPFDVMSYHAERSEYTYIYPLPSADRAAPVG